MFHECLETPRPFPGGTPLSPATSPPILRSLQSPYITQTRATETTGPLLGTSPPPASGPSPPHTPFPPPTELVQEFLSLPPSEMLGSNDPTGPLLGTSPSSVRGKPSPHTPLPPQAELLQEFFSFSPSEKLRSNDSPRFSHSSTQYPPVPFIHQQIRILLFKLPGTTFPLYPPNPQFNPVPLFHCPVILYLLHPLTL